MAAVVASSTITIHASWETSLTGARPTGTAAGDLLVAIMGRYSEGASGMVAPTGWTLLKEAVSWNYGLRIWTAPGSVASTTFTIPGDDYIVLTLLRITGHAAGSIPADVINRAGGASIATNTVTPGTASGLLIAGAHARTGTFSSTMPSGMTLVRSGQAAGLTSTVVASESWESASATGARTFTGSSLSPGNAFALVIPSGTTAPATPAQATAAGSWAFTGAATATAPAVAPAQATASGSWAFTGTAAAASTRAATAIGTVAWTGTATAVAPVVGQAQATASGTWGFVGAASAERTPQASAASTILWTGTAVAQALHEATATGTLTWTGTATAAHPIPTRDVTVTIGAATYRRLSTGPLTSRRLTTGPLTT